MIHSTLGFIYTPDFKEVLLITKQKPIGHKGKLNGLGGKCEGGESSKKCIAREVLEESNLVIPSRDWTKIGKLSWDEWRVDIFVTVYSADKNNVKALTSDPVAWYQVEKLPANVISNLRWLIPLGIDYLRNDIKPKVNIKYSTTC